MALLDQRDLAGKVAVVTGATSGIGLELASALAARGAHVVLGVRNLTAAKELADEIKAQHEGATVTVGPSLDLMSQDSVKAFAAEINKQFPKLDILVNNAGVSFLTKCFTPDGVGGIAQTNHLGPYTLTRLLEGKLVAGKGRVVTVSSILHRTVTLKDALTFLKDWRSGYYQHTKLANVLFAYEVQRRLGNLGVTSCAADPGGVRSMIWDKSPAFKKGIKRAIVDATYSPPSDGMKCVLHAATVAWEKDRKLVNGTPVMPADDLRYYARGLFGNYIICNWDGLRGPGWGFAQQVKGTIWGITAVLTGCLDWPLRWMSGGVLASKVRAVRSATQTYDAKLAAQLWDASAEVAGLPKEVQA